jgi:hypothetical protein
MAASLSLRNSNSRWPWRSLAALILLAISLPANAKDATIKNNNTPIKGQSERRTTMAEAFSQHKQSITQRELRVGGTKTRGIDRGNVDDETAVVKGRGGGATGAGKRGGGAARNGNRNDASKISGASRNRNKTPGSGRERNGLKTGHRGGKTGAPRTGVRGTGENRQAIRARAKAMKEENGSSISTVSDTSGKAKRNGESMASAVMRNGITLIPIDGSTLTSASDVKGKANK